MTVSVDFEFDKEDLASLKKVLTPEQYREAFEAAATDLAHIGEAAAKDATPVVTGHARRSSISDVRGADKVVRGEYPYLNWLDEGEDNRGRKMKTRPGGYRIRNAAMEAARRAAPEVLDRCGREVADRWAGG